MTVNKKLMYTAISNATTNMYKMKDLAKAVAETINQDKGVTVVEVDNSCSDGFTLRCHKDRNLSNSYLCKMLSEATTILLDEKYEDVLDYISDAYDLIYDSKYVTDEYAEEAFNISKNGRLISIELDL